MELLESMLKEYVGKFVFWKGSDEKYHQRRFGKIVGIALPYMKIERPREYNFDSYDLVVNEKGGVDTVFVHLLAQGLYSFEIRNPIEKSRTLDSSIRHKFKEYNYDFVLEIPRD